MAQHCYNYNFYSSFSSSPQGAPYVVVLDSPPSPLHISSPPSLLSGQVAWNSPGFSASNSSHACFLPSHLLILLFSFVRLPCCSKCRLISTMFQASNWCDALHCCDIHVTIHEQAINTFCKAVFSFLVFPPFFDS